MARKKSEKTWMVEMINKQHKEIFWVFAMSDNIKSIAFLIMWGVGLWCAFVGLAVGLWATGLVVEKIINWIF